MEVSEISVKDILHILFLRKRIILFFLVVAPILGLAACYILTPAYEAYTEVILRQLGESIAIEPPRSLERVEIESIINTEKKIITSQEVLSRTLDRLKAEGGLAEEEEEPTWFDRLLANVFGQVSSLLKALKILEEVSPRDAAILDLQKSVSLTPQPDSNVIQILVSRENPHEAAKIANVITGEYIQYHLDVYKGTGVSAFFEEKVGEIAKEIERIEEELSDYKAKEQILSIRELENALSNELSEIRSSLNAIDKAIIYEDALIATLEEQLVQEDPLVVPSLDINADRLVQQIQSNLVELTLKRSEMLQVYSPDYEEVITVEAQIDELHAMIRGEVTKFLAMHRNNLKTLRTQHEGLATLRTSIEEEIEELPRKELAVVRLERELGEEQEVYDSLKVKAEEARLTEATDERAVSIRFISPAFPPPTASSPDKMLILVVSPVIGLLLGIGIAFVRDFLDSAFKRESDVEQALEIPVLGSIREVK